ncbi:DinB family protein [Phyllobacterium sp. P30BS-XVII]|uniref:DinB family protein n=1 Tax=Phyllobacterium sp. P30BS-XVII TaxID=2587046 RepID=UPI0015FC8246|nr:DinB family protein [Phyllobacterium sp. P30BS-XVII]MBA8901619.1 putative damage-inducible protein DinB [Phyllobacterium sp. P30BS-XVII]
MSDNALRDHFSAMARNSAWSNNRLLGACAGLTDAEFAQERTSFFPSIQMTLNHNLIVDHIYMADIKGIGRKNISLVGDIPYPKLVDLKKAQDAFDTELVAFCDSLSASDLNRIISIEWHDGAVSEEPLQLVLSHLFVHQIHHRGQAHAMLAGTNVPPPQLDEFFLNYDLPRRKGEPFAE